MSKFAIYTKWHWPNGIPSIEDAEKNMKEFSDKTNAEDVLWWKADDNHHQSVIIFSSEEVANKEMEMRKNHRKESTEEHKISMVEEFVGPVLAQLSELR
jgi:hypothetical protein|tara:strand:+ start:768 stop:1064 length:297 start_codon:yes stop_codon:yes gene_type:complete